MRDPFTVEVTDMPEGFSNDEVESFLELSCDETLKSDLKRISLLDFRIQRHEEYTMGHNVRIGKTIITSN